MPKACRLETALVPGENPLAEAADTFTRALLRRVDVRRIEASVVESLLRCELLTEHAPPGHNRSRYSDDDAPARVRLRGLIEARLAYTDRDAAERPAGQFVHDNLTRLGDLLGLDAVDRAVVQFVVALHSSAGLREMTEAFGSISFGGAVALVAAAIAQPPGAVQNALSAGRAARSGILETCDDATQDLPQRLRPKDGLLDLLLTPGLDRAAMLHRFLPAAPPSSLDASDFVAQGSLPALAQRLLGAALKTRRPGVNVLLYGPTGTGKTEFARLLATELRVALHEAAVGDEAGVSLTAAGRLSSLMLGQKLLSDADALMLFDELEDLFAWDSRMAFGTSLRELFGRKARAVGQMSKGWFVQLLESNPVPTVWISNEVADVDPAFLRRFALAIEFRAPGPRQRARTLARHLTPQDTLTDADVEALTSRYAVPAATLQGAVSAARLTSAEGAADRAGVERFLAPMERLLSGGLGGRALDFDPSLFRLDAIQCPVDLVDLSARLGDWRPEEGPGLSLCLHGPPGTGKSEFVRYLAHRMGRQVIHRRVSDLQSKWVGETEKAIAAAFREADEEDAVLLFDEADSFLRDRRGAVRSWEVTQVNEFLQRLECFRGVVACTTNLVDDLDPASLRRFVFKLPFGYLKASQVAALADAMLAPHLPQPLRADERTAFHAALVRLGELTPGDFATVRRRNASLRQKPTPDTLRADLEAEVRARVPRAGRTVGFARATAVSPRC